MVTLDKAMAAIQMVLTASEDEDGEIRTDQETCERIEWELLEELFKDYVEGK